jgi:hypothetical protein
MVSALIYYAARGVESGQGPGNAVTVSAGMTKAARRMRDPSVPLCCKSLCCNEYPGRDSNS